MVGLAGRACIAVHITRWCGGRWMVKDTHQPRYTQERDPVPIVQEAGWFSGPIWTGMEKRKSLNPTGVQTPNNPAHIELLHQLRYLGLPTLEQVTIFCVQ